MERKRSEVIGCGGGVEVWSEREGGTRDGSLVSSLCDCTMWCCSMDIGVSPQVDQRLFDRVFFSFKCTP